MNCKMGCHSFVDVCRLHNDKYKNSVEVLQKFYSKINTVPPENNTVSNSDKGNQHKNSLIRCINF